ncbi:MAG: TonB-dependent receptor, partial [Muribaculaceae bacterium]|nr:TonB-dependent receptor [Muribaculaceae bacterium]
MKSQIKLLAAIAATIFLPAAAMAKEETDSLAAGGKGEERNVMLNASDATKPREIQIGLPSEDVNVYENGLPAVYSSAIHQL